MQNTNPSNLPNSLLTQIENEIRENLIDIEFLKLRNRQLESYKHLVKHESPEVAFCIADISVNHEIYGKYIKFYTQRFNNITHIILYDVNLYFVVGKFTVNVEAFSTEYLDNVLEIIDNYMPEDMIAASCDEVKEIFENSRYWENINKIES